MDNLDKVIRDNFATDMKHEGCGGDMIPLGTLEIGSGEAAVPMRFVICMDCKDDALELSLQDKDAVRRTLIALNSRGFWHALDALSNLLSETAKQADEVTEGYVETIEKMLEITKTNPQKSERKEQKSKHLFNIDPIFWNPPRK